MKRIAQLSLSLCIILAFTLPMMSEPPHAPINKKVLEFAVTNSTALDALLQLCRQEHVPFGIEYVSDDVLSKPISLKLRSVPLSKILGLIFAADKNYYWRSSDGVVLIQHKRQPRESKVILGTTLPQLSVPRTSLQQASLLLQMTLKSQENPAITGFAGSYNPGDESDLVGPFDLHDISIRDSLNLLVAKSRGAIWIFTPIQQASVPGLSSRWKVIQCQPPSPSGREGP